MASRNYDIKKEKNHYVLYADGEFICTGDTYQECWDEAIRIEDEALRRGTIIAFEKLKRGYYEVCI